MSRENKRNTEMAAPSALGWAKRFAPFGPSPLLEGKEAATYDQPLSRICVAVEPVERLLDDPNLLRRCPAPTALNRCDDLNSIRRIGHRRGVVSLTLPKWETVSGRSGAISLPHVSTTEARSRRDRTGIGEAATGHGNTIPNRDRSRSSSLGRTRAKFLH